MELRSKKLPVSETGFGGRLFQVRLYSWVLDSLNFLSPEHSIGIEMRKSFRFSRDGNQLDLRDFGVERGGSCKIEIKKKKKGKKRGFYMIIKWRCFAPGRVHGRIRILNQHCFTCNNPT